LQKEASMGFKAVESENKSLDTLHEENKEKVTNELKKHMRQS
jgi:hypothetical protein